MPHTRPARLAGALAASLAGAVPLAAEPAGPLAAQSEAAAPPTAVEPGTSWEQVDAELHVLSTQLQQKSAAAVQVGALARGHWRYSSDFEGPTGENFNGLYLDDLRLWAKGDVVDFEWAISVDFANDGDPTATPPASPNSFTGRPYDQAFSIVAPPGEQNLEGTLRDGWGQWNLGQAFAIRVGSFVPPVTLSTSSEAGGLAFVRRTYIGEIFDVPDEGAMLRGDMEQFSYDLAVMNGVDATSEDLAYLVRGDYHLGAERSNTEGAFGTQGDLEGSLGVFWYDDEGLGDGQVYGVDGRLSVQGVSLAGEWASFDDGWGLENPTGVTGPGLGLFGPVGDAEPWSVTAGYMLVPDQWELLLRWEALNNAADDERVTAGLTWYLNGHAAKLQANWVSAKSDADARDGDVLQLGFTVGMGYDV